MTAEWDDGTPVVEHAAGRLATPPGWWREASAAQQVAWARMDNDLAVELGLDQPYVMGPRIGQCPGSSGYGHGLTAVACHRECCTAWDEARTKALAEGRGEPTEIDQLMATDPTAAQLKIAKARLGAAREAGRPAKQIEQLEIRVSARQAAADAAHAAADIEAGG